jgi:YHS domain-containing protein
MAVDPVCGMQLDEKKSAATSEHVGREYYFCSLQCKQKFDQDPAQFTRKAA